MNRGRHKSRPNLRADRVKAAAPQGSSAARALTRASTGLSLTGPAAAELCSTGRLSGNDVLAVRVSVMAPRIGRIRGNSFYPFTLRAGPVPVSTISPSERGRSRRSSKRIVSLTRQG